MKGRQRIQGLPHINITYMDTVAFPHPAAAPQALDQLPRGAGGTGGSSGTSNGGAGAATHGAASSSGGGGSLDVLPGSREGSVDGSGRASIDLGALLSGTLASRDEPLAHVVASPPAPHSIASLAGSTGGTLSSADSLQGVGEDEAAAAAAAEARWRYAGPRGFPMLAVVRLEHVKHALLLGAVDPGLGGIIIAGGHGAAKSGACLHTPSACLQLAGRCRCRPVGRSAAGAARGGR